MTEESGRLEGGSSCETEEQRANETVKLEFRGGNVSEILVPASSDNIELSCFAFSLHKAGSSLLNSMLHSYCRRLGLSFIDLPDIVAKAGDDIANLTEESGRVVLARNGYGYWGWRNYARCLNSLDFLKSLNIFLVRDPRDRLVSQFFSFGRSHAIPKSGRGRSIALAARREAASMGIDDYAISKIGWIDQNWRLYHKRLAPGTTRIYRYEDIIFKKAEWLADIVDFFRFPRDDAAIEMIASAHDIRPKEEEPNAHIRQVKPGNYKAHLSTATVDQLNQALKTYLEAYGYMNADTFGERLVFASEGTEASQLFDVFE